MLFFALQILSQLTLSSYSQEIYNVKIDGQTVNGAAPFRTGANFKIEQQRDNRDGMGGDLEAGYGFFLSSAASKAKELGMIDYVQRISDTPYKYKGVRVYFLYSPLCYDQNVLSKQTEFLFADAGLGLKFKNFGVEYGNTPSQFGTIKFPNDEAFPARFRVNRFKTYGNLSPTVHFKISVVDGKIFQSDIGSIYDGQVREAHAEVACDIKEHFSIVGIVDYESIEFDDYRGPGGSRYHGSSQFDDFKLGLRWKFKWRNY